MRQSDVLFRASLFVALLLGAGCASRGKLALTYQPAGDHKIELDPRFQKTTVLLKTVVDGTEKVDWGCSKTGTSDVLTSKERYFPKPASFCPRLTKVFSDALGKRGLKVAKKTTGAAPRTFVMRIEILEFWATCVKTSYPLNSWSGADIRILVELRTRAKNKIVFTKEYATKEHVRHSEVKKQPSLGAYANLAINNALKELIRLFVMDVELRAALTGITWDDGPGEEYIPYDVIMRVREVDMYPAYHLLSGKALNSELLVIATRQSDPSQVFNILIQPSSFDEAVQIARNLAERPFLSLKEPARNPLVHDPLTPPGKRPKMVPTIEVIEKYERVCIAVRDSDYLTPREIAEGTVKTKPVFNLFGLEGHGTLKHDLESKGITVKEKRIK